MTAKEFSFLLLVLAMFLGSAQVSYAQGPDFQEFQSISTSGATDWEFFTIGGDYYLIVANHYDGSTYNVDSRLYQWNGASFVVVQSIPGGAHDWEFFTIGSDYYLIDTKSKIYQWDGTGLVEISSIPPSGARGWEFFTIGSDHCLAVANYHDGFSYNVDSKIYRWNGTTLVELQSILTNGANDWEFFTIGGDYYLAIPNSYNGFSHNINSRIYWWNGISFTEIQSILTNGAWGWEYFTIDSNHYLAVASHYNGSTGNIDSKIYQWNGSSFIEFQSIPTNQAYDWEFFTIGGIHYLVVANRLNGSTYSTYSKIYQWNGASFVEFQSIPTSGAYDWEFFTIDGDYYLAVANYYDGSDYNIDSKVYRWGFPGYGSTPAVGNTIDVGSTVVGNTISVNLAVQETGDATLNVSILGSGLLSGANPGDFTIVNGPPFSIADGGADHVVTIQCIPSAAGTRTATLTFDTNDPAQPTVSYTLTCTGAGGPAPAPLPTGDDKDDEDDDEDDGSEAAAAPPPVPAQEFDCWPWLVIVPPLGVPDASSHCLPSLGEPLPVESNFRYLGHSTEVTINDAAGVPVTQFNPPLKVCFRYTQAELEALGSDPNQFLIQTFQNGTWASLPTVPEADSSPTVLGRVCAPVAHLTLFALFSREQAALSSDSPLASVKYLPETGQWLATGPWLCLVFGLMSVGGVMWAIARRSR